MSEVAGTVFGKGCGPSIRVMVGRKEGRGRGKKGGKEARRMEGKILPVFAQFMAGVGDVKIQTHCT